jgi:hypothetical protein
MYGRGGSGFILVFDGAALSAKKVADLVPVIYEPAEQSAYIREVIEQGRKTSAEARDRTARYGEEIARKSHLVAAHAFGAMVSMYAATMKRKAFEFEKEWRLLVGYLDAPPVGQQMAFNADAAGAILRSYFEFPFAPKDLKAIVVGRVNADLNEPVVEAILTEGYRQTEVRVGKVALRSFT